jgi:hypothetical protein
MPKEDQIRTCNNVHDGMKLTELMYRRYTIIHEPIGRFGIFTEITLAMNIFVGSKSEKPIDEYTIGHMIGCPSWMTGDTYLYKVNALTTLFPWFRKHGIFQMKETWRHSAMMNNTPISKIRRALTDFDVPIESSDALSKTLYANVNNLWNDPSSLPVTNIEINRNPFR